MKTTRWLSALCVLVFSMNLCTAFAEAPSKPVGLTDDEWQMVLQHRAGRKGPTKPAELGSQSTTRNAPTVATVPNTLQELQERTAGKSFRERFVLIYRNNTLGYDFGDNPAVHQDLGGELYSGKNRTWSGLLGAVRLRESLDGIKAAYPVLDARGDVGFNAAENPQAQEEDAPASFGWTRDGIGDTEVWKGKGALYLPVAYFGDDDNPLGSGFRLLGYRNNWNVFYPAVRYDRDSSKDGTAAEVNTLDFLVGVDMNFIEESPGDKGGATAAWLKDTLGNLAGIVRLAAGVRTNFDFEDSTLLTEFSYIPVDKENSINAYLTRNQDTYDFLHKFILKGFGDMTKSRFANVKAGQVIAADGKSGGDLEDILPLGFEVGMAIRPGDITSSSLWRKLELSASYRGQWDVLNDNAYHGLLDISLSLPFIEGETSYAGWKLSYKKGDDLTNYDELDELSLGIEVKF